MTAPVPDPPHIAAGMPLREWEADRAEWRKGREEYMSDSEYATSWTMADIKEHANMAETFPGSGVLNWGEIEWEALASWVALSVEIGGDAAMPSMDVESVKGCFERWWEATNDRRPI